MADLFENPMGTDGFEFVEYTAPDTAELGRLFEQMGFRAVGKHRSKDVTLYRQGDVNFIVNAEPGSHGATFAQAHGPSACAMGFRVKDAAFAFKRALELGAEPHEAAVGPMELNIPAIKGIGGSVIYLVDRYGDRSIYDVDFLPTDPELGFEHPGAGMTYLDHVTHNVYRGNMDTWAGFYESPDGKIRIPINESSDDKSQIAEYLDLYKGEGIQHIALGVKDIYETVETLTAKGVAFQDTIDTYFDLIDQRLPGHGENVQRLRADRILIDGAEEQGLLLQIFTQNAIGPIFFELIQRKGNEGFGEGNFKALFESIELDQIRRGVISAPAEA